MGSLSENQIKTINRLASSEINEKVKNGDTQAGRDFLNDYFKNRKGGKNA
jgi:hypothetical protein